MKRMLFAFVLLVAAALLWPAAAGAQSPELTQAHRQGMALYQAGKYREAIPQFEKALRLAEREFGPEHPQTATRLNNLAELYRAQGRYPEAEPLHKRALAVREKSLGPEHPETATVLENMALLYQAQGKASQAQALKNRAEAIRARQRK